MLGAIALSLACNGTRAGSDLGATSDPPAAVLDPAASDEVAALATLTLPRAAVAVTPFGASFAVALEGHDLAFVDASDPSHPRLDGTVATEAQVVATTYDEERRTLFAVDANANVIALRAPSSAGTTLVARTLASVDAGSVRGIARLDDRVLVLGAGAYASIDVSFAGDLPMALSPGVRTSLPSEAVALAAGSGLVAIGYANGTVEVLAGRGLERIGSVDAGGAVRGLAIDGGRLAIVGAAGLAIVDTGTTGAPAIVQTSGSLADATSVSLRGALLVAGLGRGLVSLVDANEPHALRIVGKGTMPAAGAVASGDGALAVSAGSELRVLAPPFFVVSTRAPTLRATVALEASLPVLFNAPVDPASLAAGITLRCNGIALSGVATAEENAVAFHPDGALPGDARCRLDVSGVRSQFGAAPSIAPSVDGGTENDALAFTTQAAAAEERVAAPSRFAHTVDGVVTGWSSGAVEHEWADSPALRGARAAVHADYDGTNLWVLADAVAATSTLDDDCPATLYVWTNDRRFTVRAQRDGRSEVRGVDATGTALDTSGAKAALGFAGSPEALTPHAVLEARLPVTSGPFALQLRLPTKGASCHAPVPEAENLYGALGADGVTWDPVAPAAPPAAFLFGPTEASTEVSTGAAFTWGGVDGLDARSVAEVQVSTSDDFRFVVARDRGLERGAALPLGTLRRDTPYFFRVVARNAVGATASEPHAFRTTAAATPIARGLSIERSGSGRITSVPEGIVCGDACAAAFSEDTTVSLSAEPAPGFLFAGYGGDCASTATTVRVPLTSHRSCTATFRAAPDGTFTLGVRKVGEGTVKATAPASLLDCGSTCTAAATAGSNVTLVATPAAGYVFSGWDGHCSGLNESTTVRMTANKECIATFALGSFALAITKTGPGTVTSTPSGIACGATCSASFAGNTTVKLTAMPAAGYKLSTWGGQCDGKTTTTSVVMASYRACSATFVKGP